MRSFACRLTASAWLMLILLAVVPSASSAATASQPGWTITSISQPTNFAPGDSTGTDQYLVTATNDGGAPTDGSAITITDDLPTGLTPDPSGASGEDSGGNPVSCTAAAQVVTCTDPDTAVIEPDGAVFVKIPVEVQSNAPASVTNTVSVTGGGSSASDSQPTTISSSPAGFGLERQAVRVTNADGALDMQAGSHPYELTTSFAVNTFEELATSVTSGNLKDVRLDLPAGLVGNPLATPRCTLKDFLGSESCPVNTQVGLARVAVGFGSTGVTPPGGYTPVYNVQPPPGSPADFGFVLGGVPTQLLASVRTGSDYGIVTTASNTEEILSPFVVTVMLWGVPADPSHDNARGTCLAATGPTSSSCSAGIAPAALLTNPAACSSGPLSTSIAVDSWQDPGAFQTYTSTTPTGLTGCNTLGFNPSLSLQLTTTVADSPSGAQADLEVPQSSDPNGLATPELKDATLVLPAGLSLSPGSADGLVGCTAAQIALDSAAPATCPDASQIGTVLITTPILPDPLTGQIYLGTPGCSPCTNADAADGTMVHGYIQAQADGVLVKLAGTFTLNTTTGQITAHFDNNPQLPFSDLQLDFKSGPRGVLATPDACGTYTTTSDLTPWSSPFSPDATTSDSFAISSGCVSGFSPSFTAGVSKATAGAYSPFVLSLSRADTDQELQGLSVTLPPGMLAKLSGVPLCSDSDANAGTCPAASQVGTVEIAAGPGPNPFFLPGHVYLTGPYKGGPYGLAVVVPASAGPFNLGTVVVHQSLQIDPTTAQVTVVSDPFPTILDGIPLRIKRIDVNLNRPNFTVAPTSCDPMSVTGTLSSTGGVTAKVASRFQVGGCSSLGFTPKLTIALTGKSKTRSGDHPTLTARLTDPSGQANIHSAKVTLPLSLALDPNNSNHVCPYATAQAVHGGAVGCPASTIVGSASVVTPLLSKPLTGKVYLVQGIRTNKQGQQIRTLPSLLLPLRGQIALDLRAQTSVSGGKLVTTFPSIPDAPVSTFTLKLNGGPKGILVITGRGRSICQANQVGNADLGAQSGKTKTQNMTLSTPCGTPAQEKILSHTVKNGFLSLVVKTSERGRLTVTGKGLKGFRRTLGAGTHHIRVAVKRASKKALGGSRSKQRRTTRTVKVRVQLTPANARAATATFTVRM